MLTSKQRAYLRGMANSIDTILIVGKSGVIDTVVAQADSALEARELIKGKVLENSDVTSRIAADEIAEKVNADVVQVIGSKFVLFRQKKKDSQYKLPKANVKA
ncbi:MAG: YhbY family RNA-binding protein [Acutalibacteraceae bacterium]|nr:YhbY family RNA-binding protein [Acutalibacteraceae bacterium]